MCIRDRPQPGRPQPLGKHLCGAYETSQILLQVLGLEEQACLLYTSDAADERSSVDLGGRRIIKKKDTDRAFG